ncbi:hypothetical protein E4L96_02035 [Massilia arenosa]|uniref:Uncharacterized protein n=1 Tax=Zemynaea arenosa TaxID=2561931 RepID=A0A4Y9SQ81_9BURK|nr:hypothetical protein E4L96_02035 [Massilia arenosa]
MNSKALSILKEHTRARSEAETEAFLRLRHGTPGRENASADDSALDAQAHDLAHPAAPAKNPVPPRVKR